MPAPLNVGLLGLSHDHVWPNLRALAASGLGRLVAAAEPDRRLQERLRREQASLAATIYDDYDALLQRDDLDAVFVYADNRTTAELGVRALCRGLPVMLEKPMAADLAGAEALLAAAHAADLPLMVNWPTAWRPAIRQGLELALDGAVGEPIQVSYRGGNPGPHEFGCSEQFCAWLYDPERNGGGALVDYCGYGALLCRALLGQPESVTAVAAHLRKEDLAAEDNAVVVLRYPRALGLLEGSWTQTADAPGLALIVYGDHGVLLVHQPKAPREGLPPSGPGRVQVVRPDGSSDLLDPPPLPADESDGPTYFLSRLRSGAPIDGLVRADLGRDVQAILAAARRSAAEGRQVPLPLRSGR